MLRQRVIGIFREIFERHGFEPVDTPAIEYLEVLTGKAGENEKLMYRFTDHGGREVGLRYDLTVPLARLVAMHQNDLVLPFKRYHIAPVWRAERAQRGRYRELWQCDADIVGSSSMLADAEVVAILAEAVIAVGLPGCTIKINHRQLLVALAKLAGVADAQAGSVYRAIDKLDKIGRAGVAEELAAAGIAEGAVERVLELITAEGPPLDILADLRRALTEVNDAGQAIDELTQLFRMLPAFGVSEATVRLDLALARGLDYYTGPVYEAVVEEPKVGSLAGAGRYDGLIGTFLGRSVPATGMSLGLERIIEVVTEFDLLPAPTSIADVFVAAFPETIAAAAGVARQLRTAGIRVDLGLQPTKSVGEQMKSADRRGIPLAVIVGTGEVADGMVSVKNLRNGSQQRLPVDDMATRVAHLVAEIRGGPVSA